MFAGYRRPDGRRLDRRVARTPDVRTAGMANLDNGANRPRPMARGGRRDFRSVADHLWLSRQRPDAVAYAVGLYITSAYWFTASTSFANPAVTLARSLSDTFAGIAPSGRPCFCHRPNHGCADGDRACAMALAEHPLAMDLIIPRTDHEAQRVAPGRRHLSTKSPHF